MRRALISVHDKDGAAELARGLVELGWELVASGGTAEYLEDHGLQVTRVEDVTGAPELFGGRVKTLHPAIHAGILARRDEPADTAALAEHGIEPIDLVCVNLYPFGSVAGRHDRTEAEIVEMIDIGGPALVRASAKNFAHVAVLCSPSQYGAALAELRAEGDLSERTRRALAAEAFATSAAYEASIARWFGRGERFPPQLALELRKVADLPYGENPHQAAAFYVEPDGRSHLLSRVEQLGGKELSFNNLADLEAARRTMDALDGPAVVMVKHANPCGVATGEDVAEAWTRALAADPVSAFGCVASVNRPVSRELAERIASHFVEVLIAPGYEPGAVDALIERKALRILADSERRVDTPGEPDLKRVLGGVLVQERDLEPDDRASMRIVCGDVPEALWDDLLFAWTVVRQVSSNAIVIAKDGQTIGIGAGQMSRVDSVRIAVEKARTHGHDLAGAVLASDAFFPFADGPELALEAGVTAIVQPGGSRRDPEVIAAVDAAGAAMVFTGRRHFRH